MLELVSVNRNVKLAIEPHGVSERGQPTWITALVDLSHNGESLLTDTISLTTGDLDQLRTDLLATSDGRHDTVRFVTTDADFILEATPAARPGEVAVGIWLGEPYDLMRGYRFVVAKEELKEFAARLAARKLTM